MLSSEIYSVLYGCPDVFEFLGMHPIGEDVYVRVLMPRAKQVFVLDEYKNTLSEMTAIEHGLFESIFHEKKIFNYFIKVIFENGEEKIWKDVYSFMPTISEEDLYYIAEGNHKKLWHVLGAHLMRHQDTDGVRFAVWAPNARRVSVVGNFNTWDGRRHQMRRRGQSGIWEIFIPNLKEGEYYKYEIMNHQGVILPLKSDPVGFAHELRPGTASCIYNPNRYQWGDTTWVKNRKSDLSQPLSIYEVHLGSWRLNSEQNNRFLNYRELADELVEYLKYMNFTHVELLPVTEFPFDGSWGYQTLGLYAPTARFGNPDDFKYFVDTLHQAGFGVIMDWVPSHFPKDEYGLAYFDGTALYEYADTRKGEHKDWGTKVYNYSRTEVVNFLCANALFWIEEYHIDGLRVDAVASMLYNDYQRPEGQWVKNVNGGRENLEAVAFLKKMNEWVYELNKGVITCAEESTSWPMVSRPSYDGGLGFTYKWDMGWMHDSLDYMHRNPIYRKYHQNDMTFSFMYAFSENFILPLSHDEVVHGKSPMLYKMAGDRWQQFANLRAYYSMMWTHPGKQLLFMGNEFAQTTEWNFADSLRWHECQYPEHHGIQVLVRELNILMKKEPALYECDCVPEGFEWINGTDCDNSVFAYIRYAKNKNDFIVSVSNFTPVVLTGYKVGVPKDGIYEEILNSDDNRFGGGGVITCKTPHATKPGWDFKEAQLVLTLPPLSTLIFKYKGPKCFSEKK